MAGASVSFMENELRALDTRRHWSASSQTYAPGDVLLSLLAEGWDLGEVVGLEEYWHAGVRRVDIYLFELTRDGVTQTVPVQSNPVIRHLVRERKLTVELRKSESLPLVGGM